MAAKYGSLEVAKLLLQRRASPDSAGKVLSRKKQKLAAFWVLTWRNVRAKEACSHFHMVVLA